MRFVLVSLMALFVYSASAFAFSDSSAATAESISFTQRSFHAVIHYDNVLLNWESEGPKEQNFEIERSADGINYIRIGELKGSYAKEFRFTDVSPVVGMMYYRISEKGGHHYIPGVINFGNDRKYSAAAIKLENARVKVIINSPKEETLQLQIRNGLNEILSIEKIEVKPGSTVRIIDLPVNTAHMQLQLMSAVSIESDISYAHVSF